MSEPKPKPSKKSTSLQKPKKEDTRDPTVVFAASSDKGTSPYLNALVRVVREHKQATLVIPLWNGKIAADLFRLLGIKPSEITITEDDHGLKLQVSITKIILA